MPQSAIIRTLKRNTQVRNFHSHEARCAHCLVASFALLFLLFTSVLTRAQTPNAPKPATAAGFSCPAVITVTAGKPDAPGWRTEGTSADGRFAFASVAILNG